MTRLLIYALLSGLLLGNAALAAEAPARPAGVGLVLGGGGARGAAHVGVLKVLERERIPISHIAGTSMGAVVGGLYAAGYTPEEIEAILLSADWKDLFDDDPRRVEQPMRRKEDDLRFLLDLKLGYRDGKIQFPAGVIQGQKLLLLLRRLLLPTWDIKDFHELPVPFRCVSTDIESGETLVFDRGDLALAIRSSMSVPGAFAPVRVKDHLAVDGSIVNNVPVDVVRAMGAGRMIVVSVGEPLLPESDLRSPFSLTLQMLTVLIRQRDEIILRQMNPQDLLLVPELGKLDSTAFDHMAEIIPAGAKAAEAAVAQLRRFSASPAEYAVWRAHHRKRSFDPPLVTFLDVISQESKTADYVGNSLAGSVGEKLDVDRIEQGINRAYGRGTYEQISWALTERNGKAGIEVTPVDKSWGPTFLAVGMQLSDDFDGHSAYQLVVEGTRTALNTRGGEWRNRVSFGETSGIRSEFYQPWGRIGQFYALPFVEYVAMNQPLSPSTARLENYRVHRVQAGLEAGYNLSPTLQLSAGIVRGRDTAELRFGDPLLFPDDLDTDFGALVLGLTYDTLDDASFPGRGSRLELELSAYRDVLGADSEGDIAALTWDKALSSGPHSLLLGARLQTAWDEPEVLLTTSALGGFTNLSGFDERELFGDHLFLLRSVYYRRLGDANRLFRVPTFIGGSLEAGNVWDDRDDADLDDLIGAGSLFIGVDTVFGPVFFGYGHADTGDSTWYLNFGSLLRPRL